LILDYFDLKLKDLAMITKQQVSANFAEILERYPHLKSSLEKGAFLTGYTAGSRSGEKVTIFLVRSPWNQFCLQATAIGLLPPGAVLLVTDEIQSGPVGQWQAYSLEEEITVKKHLNNSSKGNKIYQKSDSSLASVATAIALENNEQESLKAKKVDQKR
jgi:hypothetical protein